MANFNYNNIQIGGKVTRNIELKQTPGGKNVCKFTVAVNRTVGRGEDQKADFFDCEAWDAKAEFISKYFRKASSIFVTGELRRDDWTDKDGNKKYTFKIRVKEVDFVDSKAESEQNETTQDEPEADTDNDTLPF